MSQASSIESSIRAGGARNALLVFADPVALDLQRRGWSRMAAPLLRLPDAQFASGAAGGWDVHFFSSGPITGRLPAHWQAHRQCGSGFGERLENALGELCAGGYERVVVVGRDCPELTATEISTAFARLEGDCPVVLGPDRSGGCYLIGIRADDVDRLRNIRWRQNTDCAEIAARFSNETVHLLPAKFDLDTAADLAGFASRTAHRATMLALRVLTILRAASGSCGRRPVVRFDWARQFQRVCWQLPPPFATALTA